MVLLDGAGYVPDSGTGCVHGVAWYARTLGGVLAAADPGAAAHAVTGPGPLAALSAVALLSDGASRLADPFHLATWADLGPS